MKEDFRFDQEEGVQVIFYFHENTLYMPWDKMPNGMQCDHFVLSRFNSLPTYDGYDLSYTKKFLEQYPDGKQIDLVRAGQPVKTVGRKDMVVSFRIDSAMKEKYDGNIHMLAKQLTCNYLKENGYTG